MIKTSVTMRAARAIYRRTFWKVTKIGELEVGGYPMGSPTFRAWARSNAVWLKASNRHPIGKLARIMGKA